MLWIGFNFVGLQLLLLVYTAQSFVLLTANIQDLKNLARKFVSDSVADQLAKLVVKATGQMSEIMGETSGKNRIKSHDISGSNEYELRNIERKGEEKEKQARYTKGDNQEYITRTTGNEERQRPNYFSNESKEKSAEREDRLLENEKTWQKSSKEISTEQTEKQDKSKARNWRDKLEKLKESEHPISTKPKNAWSMEKNEVSNNDVFSQEGPKNSFISQFVGSQDDKSKEHYRPIKQSQKFESKILDERMTASAEMPSAGSRYKKTNDHDPKTLTLEFKSPNSQKTEKKHDARESESKTLDERMSASAETPSSGSRYKKINDYDAKTLTFDFKQLESQKSESKTLDERMSASVETPSSGSRYKKVNNQDSKTLTFDFKQPNSQKTEKKHDVRKSESKTLAERMSASVETPLSGSRYKKVNNQDSKTLTFDFKQPNSQKTEKKHDAREYESKTLDERMSASVETPSSGSRYKKVNNQDSKTLTFDFKQPNSQKTEKKHDAREYESKTHDERMSASVETPSSGSRYKKVNNQDSKTLTFDFKQPNSQKTEKKHDVRKSESKTLDERMSASVETPSSGSRYKKVNNQDSKTLTFDFKQPNSQKTEKKHDAREYESKTLDERMSASAETPSSGSRYKKINDHDSKTLTFDFKQANSQKTEKPHEARESSVERYFSSRYKKIDDRNFKMTALSNESNSKSDDDALWDLETTRFRGVPLDNSEGITTIKEKTDFDQYDNRNYPKAEFIATSGQLMLPRLSSNDSKKPKPDAESWWEKNLKPSADQLKSWQLYKV